MWSSYCICWSRNISYQCFSKTSDRSSLVGKLLSGATSPLSVTYTFSPLKKAPPWKADSYCIFPCAYLFTQLSLLNLLLHSFHCLYLLSLLSPPPQHSPAGFVLYKPWGGFVLISPGCSVCLSGGDMTSSCDGKIHSIWHFLDKPNILMYEMSVWPGFAGILIMVGAVFFMIFISSAI